MNYIIPIVSNYTTLILIILTDSHGHRSGFKQRKQTKEQLTIDPIHQARMFNVIVRLFILFTGWLSKHGNKPDALRLVCIAI